MIPYLAQINTTPGDFNGNYQKIMDELYKASDIGADLVVLPELAICGYLVRDLLYLDGFIEKNLKILDQIRTWSEKHANLVGLTIIVGYADRSYKEFGKPFKNMAAIIRDGVILTTYQKQLLPFYDVFDEPRYFEPGSDLCKIEIADEICGITICEDLWNDKGQDDYNYKDNPVQRYLDYGVTTIVNLSASPWYQGKVQKRIKMIEEMSEKCNIIYVNQIGGQDELVFDGHSMFASRGNVEYVGSGDVSSCLNGNRPAILGMDKTEELVDNLVLGLKDYIKKTGHKEVVVNSSGGVDSAAVIALAAKAIGGENVHCVMMPSKFSSEGSITDAKALHEKFGCREYTIAIDHDPLLETAREAFKDVYGEYHSVADENIQARMRGMMGAMFFSNAYGALPLTTGNKTELALGYCTLYGDMSGGFNPIGDLYKDEVYDICRYLGVPREIMVKAPSAELAPGQTDEASLLPYAYLNSIVKGFIEEYISDYHKWQKYADCGGIWMESLDKAHDVNDVSREDYNRMIKKIKINEFKRRQAAPCLKVSKMAFGMGRRMPIVQGF